MKKIGDMLFSKYILNIKYIKRQNMTLRGVHWWGKVYHFYHFCSQRFWLCRGICPLLVKVPIGKPVKQSNPERHLPHVKDLCPPWWLLKWAKRYFIFIQIGELPTANATWGCLELRSFSKRNFYHFLKLKCFKETEKLKLSLLCFSFANVWWQWQWTKLPRQSQ